MLRLVRLCIVLLGFAHLPLFAMSYAGQPWLVESTSFAMISFSLDPEDIKPLLPKGLNPQLNDKNRVTTTLEVYATELIAGIPAYKIIFVVVDVADHPSKTGTPGHFAIWGRVDSQASLDLFAQQLGFPYRLASRLDITTTANSYQAVVAGPANKAQLSFQLVPSPDAPLSAQGVVDMLVVKQGKGLMKSEVPYLTRGTFAQVQSFAVEGQDDPVLNLLKAVTPDWALVSERQIFAYSHLIPVGR